MKKVLLIGDSIRAGYDKYVRQRLDGKAEVFFPGENCRFAEYVLRYLHEWKKDLNTGSDVDCVHWNAGLWDTLRLFGDGCLTSEAVYAEYIDRICGRIKLLFPAAKTIFAISTPVIEGKYGEGFIRYNKDIESYNSTAVEVVKRYGTEINDLYALLKDVPDSYHSDATHFYTEAGTKLIGDRVTELVSKSLGLSAE